MFPRARFFTAALLFLFATRAAVGQPFSWTTIAGSGEIGYGDGVGSNASFFEPYGIAADAGGTLYVADTQNDLIRMISASGTNWAVATIAGSVTGFADGTNTDAQFDYPAGIAVDSTGAVYVADYFNDAIRKLTLSGSNWVVTTLAGNGTRGSANGTNQSAQFYHPTGVAVDPSGNLFVADNGNNTIRKITRQGTNWVVTTPAGSAGMAGTRDGTNNAALFAGPWGIAADSSGRVYVSDFTSSRLRQLKLAGTNWLVTTIAGSGYGSADGANNDAQFDYPMGLTVDSAGNLYVADYYNDEVRQVQPLGTNWVVSTIGGAPRVTGNSDGTGNAASFDLPRGIAAGPGGALFVADTGNNLIRHGQQALVLRIRLTANQIVLTCPSAATNFVLETTRALQASGTVWDPVTNGVITSSNAFILNPAAGLSSAFFRLRQ